MTAEMIMEVRGANGLHARPASMLVQLAGKFQSAVSLEGGGKQASLKSLLGILGLGLRQGTQVRITATGPDAQDALQAVAAILERDDL